MATDIGRAVSLQKAAQGSRALQIETHARVEFVDVTGAVQKAIDSSGIQTGVCHLFTPHTSAAVLVQENDDPKLQKDLDGFLQRLAPRDRTYEHNDGNCDAHLKAAIVGSSKTLLIEAGRLVLGRWQGVFFCEFDGPRRRELRVKIVAD